MKLFDSRRAPNPRRVRWFMAEKQIEDIEIVQLDILKGEHRAPEFVARAGLANLPALELDDGTVITESIAICRYLETVYPEPNLFGRDARETAIIEMWSRRSEMMLSTPLMLCVRHSHPALAALERQVPEIAATNRATAERAIAVFDKRLGESEFIASDRVTMADIIAITAVQFARMVQFSPSGEHVNFTRWCAAMGERAAAKVGL